MQRIIRPRHLRRSRGYSSNAAVKCAAHLRMELERERLTITWAPSRQTHIARKVGTGGSAFGGDRFRFYACGRCHWRGRVEITAPDHLSYAARPWSKSDFASESRVLVRYELPVIAFTLAGIRSSFSPKQFEFLAARLAEVAEDIDSFRT